MQSEINEYQIVFFVVVIGVLVFYIFKFIRSISHRTKYNLNINHSEDGPILTSDEMLDEGGLHSVLKQNIAGFSVNFLTNDDARFMAFVDLGHDSGVHLVAVGDKSSLLERLEHFPRQFLVRVKLEGDFPDYFRMYCSPEKQVEIREIFQPDTMEQFVEYCRSNDFEIFHDSLYISQAENAATAAQGTVASDLTEFLTRNATTLQHL